LTLLFFNSCRPVALNIVCHKIKEGWGWSRADPETFATVAQDERLNEVGGQAGDGHEIVLDRVRLRLWKSTGVLDEDEEPKS
jgi:hypothetical protein